MGTDVFKLKNGKLTLVGYIKDNSEIDKETVGRIRGKYSESEELKLHRECIKKGFATDAFLEYDAFAEQHRNNAKAEKAAKKLLKESLRKVKFQDGENERDVDVIPDED